MLKRAPIFVGLLLIAISPLNAQVLLDVAKISCHQFATYKIAHPDRIAIWLNGYFHGKRGDLVVDTQELAGNTDKVQEYCLKNPDVPLMQAVETIFGLAN
jgi:acid stress chaperone HdeB